MQAIKDKDKELQSINKAINDNLNKLSQYLNIAYAHGAIVGADWQAVPSTAVPLEVYQNIDILGHKSQEFIKQRDEKWQEFLRACDDEYKSQIQRAKSLDIPEWYVERLKTVCSKTSQNNILQAVEDLKKAIDAFQFRTNNYQQ